MDVLLASLHLNHDILNSQIEQALENVDQRMEYEVEKMLSQVRSTLPGRLARLGSVTEFVHRMQAAHEATSSSAARRSLCTRYRITSKDSR